MHLLAKIVLYLSKCTEKQRLKIISVSFTISVIWILEHPMCILVVSKLLLQPSGLNSPQQNKGKNFMSSCPQTVLEIRPTGLPYLNYFDFYQWGNFNTITGSSPIENEEALTNASCMHVKLFGSSLGLLKGWHPNLT